MDYIETQHPSGIGTWLLILGCPRDRSDHLHDRERGLVGPSFATCANCEHQVGTQFEHYDEEADWSVRVFPEFLECGFTPETA
ncbi:MAG TPA: hypothetical protein VJ549_03200 [Geothrix sp.]|nr:hypothetical protein [Geothrix sp.]